MVLVDHDHMAQRLPSNSPDPALDGPVLRRAPIGGPPGLHATTGVYLGRVGTEAPPRFLPLPPPDPDEVARVLAGTARRIAKLVESRAGEDEDALE